MAASRTTTTGRCSTVLGYRPERPFQADLVDTLTEVQ
ncbi:hypothetical protein MBT84_01195 [Streptomyces sp. MBT84]|nr:hypothetical protein [Streptomyces sp. MBT84]